MTEDAESRPAEPAHPPEGHTDEEPAPSELGRPGTPGAAALDHDDATHMDAHATLSDDDHAEDRLGPIDWGAWGYAIVGILAGVAVLAAFWLALA